MAAAPGHSRFFFARVGFVRLALPALTTPDPKNSPSFISTSFPWVYGGSFRFFVPLLGPLISSLFSFFSCNAWEVTPSVARRYLFPSLRSFVYPLLNNDQTARASSSSSSFALLARFPLSIALIPRIISLEVAQCRAPRLARRVSRVPSCIYWSSRF